MRLKQFVRGLVPRATPAPVVRFEDEPDQQMQVDWASIVRGTEKLKVFVATLGWSHVEFCLPIEAALLQPLDASLAR